jgi:hypothetical protein
MIKLIRLTEDEKKEANKFFNDPDAWVMVEEKANREIRSLLLTMALGMEKAARYPDDPDCKRFTEALNVLIARQNFR